MSEKLLTKKRAKWASQRTDVVFKGAKLSYNASQQNKYIDALTSLVERMSSECSKKIIKLFKSETADQFYDTAMDANIASQARILTNALMDKFEKLFASVSKPLSEKMVNGADKTSKTNLYTSLKDLSGGVSLKTNILTEDLSTVIKASVSENVSLIKSIADYYLGSVQKAVMRSITSANGLQTLQPALEKYEGITKRKAKNIALDQTRKVYNAINKGRMEKIGITEFEWLHSGGGQHPRKDHMEWNGKIFSFDNLPIDAGLNEPVIPGQAPNCKCTMRPVIQINKGNNAGG